MFRASPGTLSRRLHPSTSMTATVESPFMVTLRRLCQETRFAVNPYRYGRTVAAHSLIGTLRWSGERVTKSRIFVAGKQ